MCDANEATFFCICLDYSYSHLCLIHKLAIYKQHRSLMLRGWELHWCIFDMVTPMLAVILP